MRRRPTATSVAMVGENRKLLVFPLDAGARDDARQGRAPAELQGRRHRRHAHLRLADGLTWSDSAGRTFTKSREELAEWIGDRASAGRMAPKGFPRSGKFNGNG